MLINEIPDDCLLAIFDYLNNLGDLINCYKVCVKWSYLIVKRTKKAKYLIGWGGYASDTVYYQRSRLFDATYLSKLFTNLTIAELSSLHIKVEDAIEFVRKQESLKGLINRFDEPIEKYCDELEMLSVDSFNPNNLQNGSSLKQLDIQVYSIEALKRDAHHFPNLERLRIAIKDSDNPYDGPVLEKLKILEFSCYYSCHPGKIFNGCQLMDLCPNLQSAQIMVVTSTWFFDETLKHKCLQDLVIQFVRSVQIQNYGYEDEGDNWNILKRLLMKYPNLKHLALRDYWNITDEHIEQLIHILPNLVLLNVIGCEVTQRAADYIKDHCERYGRSIKFYFDGNEHEIKSDWPQLSIERKVISRGFDFMKNCFFKDFGKLSHLLIPIDSN